MLYLCLRVCVHAYIQCICCMCLLDSHGGVDSTVEQGQRSGNTAASFFLNWYVLFARGESDKHVQHCVEEKSGANFETHLISIFCTYFTFSDECRVNRWELSVPFKDTLLLNDSSKCWGRVGERIVSLATSPEAGLIRLRRSEDARSVAVNTAYFLSALEGCSSPTDAKCKMITLSILVTMTAALKRSGIVMFFTPSVY